jgi:hypothetical protein
MENQPGLEHNKSQDIINSLNLQERVLCRAMLYKSNAVSDYVLNGDRKSINDDFSNKDFDNLVDKFKNDPIDTLRGAASNLFLIMRDGRLSREERLNRVKRYTDNYLSLMVKLDRKAFPADPYRVESGVPVYIPDGLSDMGANPSVEVNQRNREKIRVDKKKTFDTAKSLFYDIFSLEIDKQTTSEDLKKNIINKVASYVYENIGYDYDNYLNNQFNGMLGKSTNASFYLERKKGVCRHHAIITQVLLQSLGIKSLLMKSDVSFDNNEFSSHANNLVRVDGNWYLLDVTNPRRIKNDEYKIFHRPILDSNIDLNRKKYDWTFKEENGDIRDYKSRSNMYYRIMDNVKNPV